MFFHIPRKLHETNIFLTYNPISCDSHGININVWTRVIFFVNQLFVHPNSFLLKKNQKIYQWCNFYIQSKSRVLTESRTSWNSLISFSIASFFAMRSFTFFIETSAILKIKKSATRSAGPKLFITKARLIFTRSKITWQLLSLVSILLAFDKKS